MLACVVVDATRFEPEPTGELRVALLQGNDQNRDIPVASAEFVPITENHFELAESLEGNYDLIVFPESALYADPEATRSSATGCASSGPRTTRPCS